MNVIESFPKHVPIKIKTRYDDVTQDIIREKTEKYLKAITNPEPKQFRTIEELIGKKLDIKL